MKQFSFLCILIVLVTTSCEKQTACLGSNSLPVSRKIQFVLYTYKDFTSNQDSISFKVFIQNAVNQVLWDSTLAPMKFKDIPDLAHKIVVEKTVPANETSVLKAGFFYTIQNVGASWYYDSVKAGESLKIIDYNFK